MSRFGAYIVLLSALLGCALVSPSTGEIKAIEHQAQLKRFFTSLPASVATYAEKGDTTPISEAADTARKAAFAPLLHNKMDFVTGISQLSCQQAEIQYHVTCSYTVKLLRFGPAFNEGGQAVEFTRPQEITEVKQNVGFTRNAGKWTINQR